MRVIRISQGTWCVELFHFGKWRLDAWNSRHQWRWIPCRDRYWGGKLTYYSWLCFNLVRDDRGYILDEMFAASPGRARNATEKE